MACPFTYEFVHLDEKTKDRINKEKKPRLFIEEEQKDSKIIRSNYKFLDKEIIKAIVGQTFRLIYQNQMVLPLEALNPAAQEDIRNTIEAIYEELGVDIMMES